MYTRRVANLACGYNILELGMLVNGKANDIICMLQVKGLVSCNTYTDRIASMVN